MRLQREKGSAGVEFALLLPIIALLVFGMMEFGVALYNIQIIKNASRQGARAGIIRVTPKPTAAEIKAVIDTYLTEAAFDPNEATVTITGDGGDFGVPLTVTVSYPYEFNVLPGLITGFASTFNLQSTITMSNE